MTQNLNPRNREWHIIFYPKYPIILINFQAFQSKKLCFQGFQLLIIWKVLVVDLTEFTIR